MEEYRQLITTVYDKLDRKTEQDFFINNSEFERLEEHNLWTYWQGRDVRHPKIMVVGQDWGSVEQSKKYFEYIKNHPEEKLVSYVQVKKDNPEMKKSEFMTDRELQCFFNKHLGYTDICQNQHKDLYFTNLIPGFRNGTSSTGNSSDAQKEITEDVLTDFKQLLEILHPEFIICLGRIVSESIDRAYNGAESIIARTSNFNAFLEKELYADVPQPIVLDLGNGNQTKMFILAHMGGLGRANRMRFFRKNHIKRTVEDDWAIVANYIKALSLHGKETPDLVQ